ncbi:MAG: hypothetical protein RBG13Loki_1199 [Promethearchaeota archaeon CR_4]|nr:MAG: hypothetical protein RBG13Loki_1199 [Candidatus Lokiarchaeota archaeon CR_4]
MILRDISRHSLRPEPRVRNSLLLSSSLVCKIYTLYILSYESLYFSIKHIDSHELHKHLVGKRLTISPS